MVSKDEVLKVISQKGQSPNIIKHLLAVGGAMRALAEHFNEDMDQWEIAGILHDADYNLAPLDRHGYEAVEWFKGQLAPDIERAVISHNFANNGVEPQGKMGWALYSVDNLAGLIIASALVRPDKKLEGLTAESVLKRFGETSFAKGANREEIKACSKIGLDLKEFVDISLRGINSLAGDLGL
ncbi:MAG TPA: HD domain-containing protein [Patescibacteria group bacterium]|nr:HD domain-containing protein [Patescibacteria group bacterium]